ncbi:MAG TPA: type II secretion system F family protein [Candidatus Brocadiia bacterium]|nr:type II secretion system F family protein [Candidatus Brocadiales bacterium]
MIYPFLIFFAVFFTVIGIYFLLIDTDIALPRVKVKKRLKGIYRDELVDANAGKGTVSILREGSFSDIPVLHRHLEKKEWAHRLDRFLVQANSFLAVGQFVLLSVVLGAIGILTGYFLSKSVIITIPSGFFTFFLPYFYVRFLRKRRMNLFARQFPDALELMARALRAGHALPTSFKLVGDELPSPIGPEFERTFEEQNLGITLEEALNKLAERIDSLDLKYFVTAVLIQRATGGNLAEVLDKISYIVRERFKLKSQIKALTAEGRLSGIVLGFLPIAIGVVIYMMNPNYIKTLYYETAGNYLVGAALMLQILGFLTIKKIVNIKY